MGYVTPLKINMEPKKWRFGRFFFLFNRVMFRFQPLIFRGVMKMATNRTSYYLRKSIGKPNHSHILLKKKQPLSKPIIISNNCLEKTTFYHRNSNFPLLLFDLKKCTFTTFNLRWHLLGLPLGWAGGCCHCTTWCLRWLWDPLQMTELHGWNKWAGDPNYWI